MFGKFSLKFSIFSLNILIFLSCGIKKEPKPLPFPDYRVYRIGEYVYVVPKIEGIYIDDFERKEEFFRKKESENFCFTVAHVKGKRVNVCVDRATSVKLRPETLITKDEVVVRFQREGLYRVYPFRGELIPTPLREIRGKEVSFKRTYNLQVYAVTRVIGSVETSPVIVEVPPKKPPKPEKPEDVSYSLRGGKIYIYWRSEDESVIGFLVYKNGKLLTEKPITQNLIADEVPREKAIYRIISVNRFGVKSDPAILIYKP